MPTSPQRQRILVQGIVQGVGFRPLVYGQVTELGGLGLVLNDDRGVTIEVEGSSRMIKAFNTALTKRARVATRVDSLKRIAFLFKHVYQSPWTAERRSAVSWAGDHAEELICA